MSHWDFCSIGFICEKNNIVLVKELLECMGIDFDDVRGSADGEINNMFWDVIEKGCDNGNFKPEEIYSIVSKIFDNTTILFECEEGNSISDWYSRYEKIFDSQANKVYIGEYDYCIGNGESKEISEWEEDIESIEIDKELVDKIISSAKEKGYNDIEKLIIDVIVNGNKSPYNNGNGKGEINKEKSDEFVIQSGLLLKYKGNDKVVIIPEGVNRIHNAFAGNQKICEVIIPEGVTRIGESAFSGCNKLVKVTIPQSVNEIAKAAFYYTGIKSIVLPEGIKEIAKETFMNCINLKEITIPKSVTKIGDYAFSGCNKLKKVVILNNDVDISKSAFKDWMYEKKIIKYE